MLRATFVIYEVLMPAPLHPTEVAFFTECYRPIINGVVASIDGLRDALASVNVGVTIVAPHFPHERDANEAIVRLQSLPLPTSTGYRLCVPYMSRAVRERIRNVSLVHVHSPFVTGWIGSNFARRSCVPLVFTYHTRIDEYAHYAPFEPHVARAALTTLTRTFANRADAVIVPTAAMQQRLRDFGVHVPIAVVPSSIDVEQFAAGRRTRAVRAMLGGNDDARIVLTVSRIAREKHLELALDALARTRDVRLAIVGDGPDRARLEKRVADLGVRDRVQFTGALAPAAMPDGYASSDAVGFPSPTETQGLVLAEALAAGLPVVAADGAVNREVLGGFGRLVPPDPQAYADALTAAVAAPRDPAGLESARLRFGRARQAEAVMNVYRSVSLCRTFGTPVREYAPGSESYR
jgi:glycosyltransferase involved in cell wall biosynthesis